MKGIIKPSIGGLWGFKEENAHRSYLPLHKCSINGSCYHYYFSQRIFHSRFHSHSCSSAVFSPPQRDSKSSLRLKITVTCHIVWAQFIAMPILRPLVATQGLSDALEAFAHGLQGDHRGVSPCLTMPGTCFPLQTSPRPWLWWCSEGTDTPSSLSEARFHMAGNHQSLLTGSLQVPESRRRVYINTIIFIRPPGTTGYIDVNFI